jgi:SAM-dependent MidA family methyltransferase
MSRARPNKTALEALLVARITASGPILFSEYMEACLYDPDHGYYEAGRKDFNGANDNNGNADYYTSAHMGGVYGRLLARQFEEMWRRAGQPERFTLVESGAGNGRLAACILDFAEARMPKFYAALEYITGERSARRREEIQQILLRHIAAGRTTVSAQMPERIPQGCLFSNELVDAFPIRRVIRKSGKLLEIRVGYAEGALCDTFSAAPAHLGAYFEEQGIELCEGQEAEVNLEACAWIEAVGHALERGFVVTVDYGHEAKELYNERHMRGTLLTFSRHRAGENYYDVPGQQDLTAHVNFTALEKHGERSGLERTGLAWQGEFLMALAREENFQSVMPEDENAVGRLKALLQFKALIHPEGMGESFRVLIQHKGFSGTPKLTGLLKLGEIVENQFGLLSVGLAPDLSAGEAGVGAGVADGTLDDGLDASADPTPDAVP